MKLKKIIINTVIIFLFGFIYINTNVINIVIIKQTI